MPRTYIYPADVTACGHFRLIWPAEALRAQGHHDVQVIIPQQRGGSVGINGHIQDGNLISVDIPPDADVIVLQRITHKHLAQAVPLIRAKGVAVVIDIDDDLTTIHPSNAAFTAMHPRAARAGSPHSWHHTTQACAAATLVTVSTPALLRTYAPHGRGIVLHNRIPAAYLNVPHPDNTVIGWGGSVHSHPDDLQTVGPAIARLTRTGHRFGIVGDGIGVKAALGLDEDPLTTGVVPLADWPAALATLGIGIAPLVDSKFNRGKSWLKALEYSACGVPWVASPRAEYRRLHTHGIGMLADRPRDWHRALAALAKDPARRLEMSAAGRDVAAGMTIEGHAWQWMSAWEEAHHIEQRYAAVSAFSARA